MEIDQHFQAGIILVDFFDKTEFYIYKQDPKLLFKAWEEEIKNVTDNGNN